MRGKRRWIGSVLLLSLSVAVVPLQAQRGQGRRGPGQGGPGGPNMGQSLELALENQEMLELSQAQVAQLQELKRILDEDVAGLAEEMKLLREQIRGGEVVRDEGVRQMEALRGALITASAPLKGKTQEILTAEQHARLQRMAGRARPGVGRAGAPRGNMATFRGRGGGVGVQGQFPGGRGGGGFQRALPGRGRGMVPGNPMAFRGFRAQPAPRPIGSFRGGRIGGLGQEVGNGWNLP